MWCTEVNGARAGFTLILIARWRVFERLIDTSLCFYLFVFDEVSDRCVVVIDG